MKEPNAGEYQAETLEKARRRVLPLETPDGAQPRQHLGFTKQDPFHGLRNHERINWCCSTLLSLPEFVTAATGKTQVPRTDEADNQPQTWSRRELQSWHHFWPRKTVRYRLGSFQGSGTDRHSLVQGSNSREIVSVQQHGDTCHLSSSWKQLTNYTLVQDEWFSNPAARWNITSNLENTDA